MNYRRIARHVGISHQTVINWVNVYSAQLLNRPQQPQDVGVVELDELYTFIGKKKSGLPDDVSGSPQQLCSRLGRGCRTERSALTGDRRRNPTSQVLL